MYMYMHVDMCTMYDFYTCITGSQRGVNTGMMHTYSMRQKKVTIPSKLNAV